MPLGYRWLLWLDEGLYWPTGFQTLEMILPVERWRMADNG